MDPQITDILRRYLTEEFVDGFQDELTWRYSKAYEDRISPPGGFESARAADRDQLDLLSVRRARRENGMRALIDTCRGLKVPYQLKSLPCNGQKLAAAQLGQLLLISEPIDCLHARPEYAQYKEDLAASHFAIRQLEMDLGDGYRQRIDARNTMLGVIQHGMRAGGFNRRDTSLAMMRLVVPDASFGSWLWQTNVLNNELAFALDWHKTHTPATRVQEDNVTVVIRSNVVRKDRNDETG